MVNIQGPNVSNLINQAVYNAMSGANSKAESVASKAVTAEVVYNLFFKEVKTKKEFRDKIRNTLAGLNKELKTEDLNNILESLELKEQPPFCASYSEEGVSKELNLQDAIIRSDIYDVLHLFYSKLYDEAAKKI